MNYSLKVGESPRIELTGLKEPIAQAYEILHWGFTIAPILAGADKFFHLFAIGTNIWRRRWQTCSPSAGTPSCSSSV
jgi:hypothetical protein